jgi:hypothetical protein
LDANIDLETSSYGQPPIQMQTDRRLSQLSNVIINCGRAGHFIIGIASGLVV